MIQTPLHTAAASVKLRTTRRSALAQMVDEPETPAHMGPDWLKDEAAEPKFLPF
jgi:hypothetical protein